MYVHTIEGRPAFFSRRLGCIVFALGSKVRGARTMRQILRERRISAATIRKHGGEPSGYGVLRVA